ncbi:MAG TPA: NRDE family protein [Flavobacterium sp.]|nr:NRDE family protein [Flavobacterium sp.]
MCTVTFVSSKDRVIITSNRDEQVLRPAAAEPKKYRVNSKNIIFPKDPKGGGTWYAVDENGTVAVLLNGAAERHEASGAYRKSRGLIVLDISSSPSSIKAWDEISLDAIEPFTLVLYESQKLYQLRWDGAAKDKTQLDASKSHIWSSSTLYDKDAREQRAGWFSDYAKARSLFSEDDIFHFHRHAESGNLENGLVISRGNSFKTLSITQAILDDNKVKMKHLDLASQKEYESSFAIL